MRVRPDISGRLENLWLIWAEDFGPGKIKNKFDLGSTFCFTISNIDGQFAHPRRV